MAIRFLSGQTIDGTLTVTGNVQAATFNSLPIETARNNTIANSRAHPTRNTTSTRLNGDKKYYCRLNRNNKKNNLLSGTKGGEYYRLRMI